MSMNFGDEDKQIKTKILQADYPLRFMDSIIRKRSICTGCGRLVYYPIKFLWRRKTFHFNTNQILWKKEQKFNSFFKKFHHFTNEKNLSQ